MKLFEEDPKLNILPYDGEGHYFGRILTPEQSVHYYEELLTGIDWRHDEAIIFGKHIVTARKVAWYADSNYSYTYSNTTKHALPWTQELLELKELTEQKTGEVFNSCLLNLYHNGNEGMAWHSDDEKALGEKTVIGSLTLGAERKFAFKHKRTKETRSLQLEAGSLLVMKGHTQKNWLHRLPPTKKVKTPRINLTFRVMNG